MPKELELIDKMVEDMAKQASDIYDKGFIAGRESMKKEILEMLDI
jgi:hypothetical protein